MLSASRKEELWAEHCYEVGRAMHEGWKRQKIANGFAVHPDYKNNARHSQQGCTLPVGSLDGKLIRCGLPLDKHHADMIDWDLLPLHQQAINYEGGKAGFLLGLDHGYQEFRSQGYQEFRSQGYQEFMRELRSYAQQFLDQPAVIEVYADENKISPEWKEKNS